MIGSIRQIRKLESPFASIARAISNNYRVVVEMTGCRCDFDGKKIRLPYNSDNLSDRAIRTLNGELDHEVCHAAEEEYSKNRGLKGAVDIFHEEKDNKVRSVFNAFEDVRIELKYGRIYPGMKENLDFSNLEAAGILKSQYDSGELDDFKMLMCLVISTGLDFNLDWIPEHVQTEYNNNLELFDSVKTLSDSEESYELAKKASALISFEPPPGSQAFDYKFELKEKIERESKRDALKNERYIPHPECLSMDRWIKPSTDKASTFSSDLAELKNGTVRLRRVFLETARAEKERAAISDRDSGYLDSSALHSVITGNRSVYYERGAPIDMSMAVLILLDLSGSMGSAKKKSSKAWHVRVAATGLSETIDKLGIPLEVIGYHNNVKRYPKGIDFEDETYQARAPFDYILFKEFGERLSVCRNRFSFIDGYMDNADGEAVLSAAKRLIIRQEKRKVLIVLSDGAPLAYGCDEGILGKHLIDSVKKVTQSGVEVLSIGVLTVDVAEFYNRETGADCSAIESLDDLPLSLYSGLGKKLFKKKGDRNGFIRFVRGFRKTCFANSKNAR